MRITDVLGSSRSPAAVGPRGPTYGGEVGPRLRCSLASSVQRPANTKTSRIRPYIGSHDRRSIRSSREPEIDLGKIRSPSTGLFCFYLAKTKYLRRGGRRHPGVAGELRSCFFSGHPRLPRLFAPELFSLGIPHALPDALWTPLASSRRDHRLCTSPWSEMKRASARGVIPISCGLHGPRGMHVSRRQPGGARQVTMLKILLPRLAGRVPACNELPSRCHRDETIFPKPLAPSLDPGKFALGALK